MFAAAFTLTARKGQACRVKYLLDAKILQIASKMFIHVNFHPHLTFLLTTIEWHIFIFSNNATTGHYKNYNGFCFQPSKIPDECDDALSCFILLITTKMFLIFFLS